MHLIVSMEGKPSAVAVISTVAGTFCLILILLCLALQITLDGTLVQLFECNNNAAGCVECAYFRIASLFLMVAAILTCIFLAQFVVSICDHSECFGVLYSSSAFNAVAILGFLFSWCACVSAIIVYMIGAAKQYGVQFPNRGNILLSMSNIMVEEDTYCNKVKNEIFGAASLLSFAGVSLGIISYVALTLGDHSKLRFQAQCTPTHLEA